ncbi:hypothetical protein ACE38W_22325 [Chitinophaga sp. Hz27]|uniref:hypothetical protein n=1 Tax=Chitinophaga sp. Hz27 TaxID=3347169 RepID=UPI0035D9EF0B
MAYTRYTRNNYSYSTASRRKFFSDKPRKKSGCRMRSGWTSRKTGERVDDNYITGWNKSMTRGFITFIASPRKERETASPHNEHWVVTVQFSTGKKTFTGFYNLNTKRLTIPDLQMVANPNAPNGGYFGTNRKRK